MSAYPETVIWLVGGEQKGVGKGQGGEQGPGSEFDDE